MDDMLVNGIRLRKGARVKQRDGGRRLVKRRADTPRRGVQRSLPLHTSVSILLVPSRSLTASYPCAVNNSSVFHNRGT